MYSASRGIPAVSLLFVSCLSGTVAFSQSVNFIRHVADPLPLVNLHVSPAPCTAEIGRALSGPNVVTPATGDSSSPCDTPPVSVLPVNPCDSASLARAGCNPSRDLIEEDLATKGKPGQKIMRARDRVLEILQTENACSAWFRGRDSNPAATFRTLNFLIDRKGEAFIRVSKDAESQTTYRNPYIASVGQDMGAFSIITLNAEGAFFRAQATTLVVLRQGELTTLGRPQFMNVGPYLGNTLVAQTLALLHEFGHVLNLLPVDFDNQDGKSMQNTDEVLRYCRAEVESKSKRATLSVTR